MDEQSLHILVVEDNPTDVFLLKKALEEVQTLKIVLTQAKRLDEALQHLTDNSFDVVLLDLGLPDSQGLETFQRLQREHSKSPILILSGLDNESLSVQAVQDGAQDFLVKGRINGKILTRTIRYAIERKRSEQRLLASESGYRRLFETARDGIFILDAESGKIIDANPFLGELLGYSRDEFVGKRLWEIAPFRDKIANRAAFRTLQEKGAIRYDDVPLATQDGRFIDVEFVSNVYEVGNQRVIQCNIRDITARKRAEAKLRESEARKVAVFETALDCIISMDDGGRVIEFNPAAEQTFGYSRDEAVGQLLADLIIPPALREHHHRGLAHFMATGEGPVIGRRIEVTAMRADGTEFGCELAISPVHLGERTIFTGYLRDISERIQAEVLKQESQRFLQSTLDALSSHIAVLDEKGEIVAVNKAWEEFAEENEGAAVACGIGANYLGVCARSEGAGADAAAAFYEGIRAVIDGRQHKFSRENPCHSPSEKRWFNVSVTRFEGEGPVRVVVAHEDITAQKLAENLISTSEANLAKSQQMAHLGSWELDLSNRDDINANPLRWSDEIFRILGYAPGEFEPSNEAFFRAVHPDDQARLSRLMAEAVQGGKPYSTEHRILLPDGRERIVHAQSEIIYSEETGQPLKMVGLGQDITERKNAEEMLRRSELNLATAQQMAHLGSWELDLSNLEDVNSNPLHWSDEAFRIFGYEPGQVESSNDNFFRAVHPDDHERVSTAVAEALRDGKPYSLDHRVVWPGGEERIVHEQAQIVFDEETGKPLRMVGTVQDVTERKQTEEALRKNETKFRTIFETALDAILLANDDGVYVDANPAACTLFGLEHEQLVGRSAADFAAPAHRDAVHLAWKDFLRAGQQSGEFEFQQPSGAHRQAEFRAVAGLQSGVHMSILRDITDRKVAETTLLESEARFRTAISEAPVPIMIHREDGKVLQISKGWTEYSGYDLEDVPTIQDWTERAYGEDWAEAHEYIKALYGVEQTRSEGQWTITAKNGQKRVWDFITTPLGTFGDNQRVIINTAFDITESKQAKEALEATTREIVTTWESMTDAFFSLDTQWRITHINSQAASLMRSSAEALKGKILWEEFPSTVESKFYTEYHRARSEQVTVNFEEFFPLYNAWFEVHAYPSSIGLSVYFRDITDRKQAEASLIESQQRLALATESAQMGIWDWDAVQNKMVWDAQMFALYGIREQDFSSAVDAWQSGIHPEDRAKADADVSAALDGSRDFRSQFRVIWPSGEVRFIEARAIMQRADDGSPLRMIGLNWDITEAKEAENLLRASEERFQSIVANVPGMIYQYVMQPDGTLEMPFVSEGCRDIYEAEPETLKKHPHWPFERVHPDDRDAHDASIAASAQTLAPWHWEYRILLDADKTKWIQGAARPQRLPAGGILWDGLLTDISARKEAEEERDRFFTLSLDMLAIVGSDGYLKRINPAWEITLGFSNAEMMAVPFLEWVHPDDIASTLVEMAKLTIGVQVMQFENRYRCRDGSYKWLRWMSAPSEDLWYCVAHDVTAMREAEAALQRANDDLEARVEERTTKLQLEVLERQRVEQEVRAQARQHEAVAELGRRALLNFDLETLLEGAVSLIITTLNVSICSFWERLPGTDKLRRRISAGLSAEMPFPPDKTIGDNTQIGYTALYREPVISDDLEHEIRFRPAQYLVEMGIHSLITVPVHDGEFYGVIGACSPNKRNFSQNEIYFLQTVGNVLASAMARKQSEAENFQLNLNLQAANEELRANEARLLQGNQISTDLMRLRVRTHDELQTALQQITEAASTMLDIERSSVWLFNEDGTAMRCADLYERGANRHSNGAELLADETYFPAIKAQREVVADDARNNPVTRGFSEAYLSPNGITSILDVALIMGGKHIGVLCCEHVGTPRQWQAEDRTFASAIASVCSLVLESYERTRAEIALQAAKEEAEHATEEANLANLAKSEFLSRMSHELRTPLNAILGFGQILDKQQTTPLGQESIGYILKGGRHLLDLINEVLDIARVESGHIELSLEPIALDDIVPEACALMKGLAAERQIRLDVNMADLSHNYVLADRQRLKQVLINLLANAIKYNHEGGQVEVSCRQKPDGWISLAVRDSGPGISPPDLLKLFTPFERLSASNSEVEGTGLGLVLSQRLVSAMGGTLNVESTLGQGSTFTIDLPQTDPIEAPVATMPRNPLFTGAEQEAEGTYSVLCIEDNLSNIRLMETIFDMRPEITLLTAIQGSTGLDMARQHEPDLILLDLNLPDIHGSEVLTRLQQSALTRDIPVVVISADATPNQLERLLSAGAKDYLTKPLDVGQLLRVVDKFLQAPAAIATSGSD